MAGSTFGNTLTNPLIRYSFCWHQSASIQPRRERPAPERINYSRPCSVEDCLRLIATDSQTSHVTLIHRIYVQMRLDCIDCVARANILTIPVIVGIAGGVALAAIIISLFYSPGADPGPEEDLAFMRPPNLTMLAEGKEYSAAIGSYCGRNGCADSELETFVPDETNVISRGAQVNFTFHGYIDPDMMTITFYDSELRPIDDFPSLNMSRAGYGFLADVPEGEYVFLLQAKWEEPYGADASYAFRTKVV